MAKKNPLEKLAKSGQITVGKTDPAASWFFFPRHFPPPKKFVVDQSFSPWLLKHARKSDSWGEEIYSGKRSVFERFFKLKGNRLLKDFSPFPTDASWCLVRFTEGWAPVLRDDNSGCILVVLTHPVKTTGAKSILWPDPDQSREVSFMQTDVWFEDCGDGGVYILGLGQEVYLFYVDGPGDQILSLWKCSREHWLELWLRAFGSREFPIP